MLPTQPPSPSTLPTAGSFSPQPFAHLHQQRISNNLYLCIEGNDILAVQQMIDANPALMNEIIFMPDGPALQYLPFHVAAMFGHVDLMNLMISRYGVNVNQRIQADYATTSGNTPLHCARGAAATRFLLQHECDVHATNAYGKTALHVAAEDGDVEKIDVLMEFGAKVDVIESGQGRTPLLCALDAGAKSHNAAVKLLNQYRANPCIKDKFDRFALHYVKMPGLVGHVMQQQNVFPININEKDGYGCTPLHYAVFLNSGLSTAIIKEFVQFGADLNARDRQGYTPIHLSLNRIPMNPLLLQNIKTLIESGADPTIPDYEGKLVPTERDTRIRLAWEEHKAKEQVLK